MRVEYDDSFACGTVRCGAVIRIPIFPPAFLIRQERRRRKKSARLIIKTTCI